MKDLNRKMAKGVVWMSVLRLSVRMLSLISTVILARLLVPEDFGIVAMATSIIALLELATAFSFEVPLIQKQDPSREDYDSAWTLNVLFYACLTVCLLLLAAPAASFYQEERLKDVIPILAIGFMARGFGNIGVVKFQKELQFNKDFLLLFLKKFGGFCVTIPLAFLLRRSRRTSSGTTAGNPC